MRVRSEERGRVSVARPGRRNRILESIGRSLAGPLLIAGAVLIVDRDFAFGGRITYQHGDILSLVLPTYCFLGKGLAAGHIPAWNPTILSGMPFAADPQSGWMYAPAMLLFSALPCAAAIRWYIVLQPLLAGLAIYAFLRSEGLLRPAATLGGVALGLVIADSYISLSLALSATVAWTAVLLAAASRMLGSRTWPGRLAWMLAAAAAWGQLAAAYLSTGLALGTSLLVLYLAARLVADWQKDRQKLARSAIAVGLLIPSVPLVNLAYLLPRLAYLPRTTLAFGYDGLRHFSAHLVGAHAPTVPIHGLPPTWPLGFMHAPGSYLGAATLVLVFGAFWSSRHRALAVAFGAYGLLLYVLALRAVDRWVGIHFADAPGVDFYLHNPDRVRYGMVLAPAVLGAIGLAEWLRTDSWARRIVMVLPGLVLWSLLPLLTGVTEAYSILPLWGLTAAAAALGLAVRDRRLVALVPVFVAAELVIAGMQGQQRPFVGLARAHPISPSGAFRPVARPTIRVAAFTRPDPIARFLAARRGRHIAVNPEGQGRGAYIWYQQPRYWALERMNRSMLFGIEDVEGYNSVQPVRYWAYVRVANRSRGVYNMASFPRPSPSVLDLLDVRWVIGSADEPPLPGMTPVLGYHGWELYRRSDGLERASVVPRWTVVGRPGDARTMAASPRFDSRAVAVLERTPFPRRPDEPAPRASVRYRPLGSQSARIDVRTNRSSVLLVRNTYDVNWRATVDGRPVRILHADYVLQAVVVRPGHHVVLLSYDDPTVGWGLVGSAATVGVLLGAIAGLRVRRRSEDRRGRSGARSVEGC
jgi:hypothetical protein